ncbi:hypothetical protein TorRG33x02_016680, partial [Trema orientale]
RTWSVNFSFIEHEKMLTARLKSGWITFARDNNLEVGDVCIFVLLEARKTTFKVVIFRVNGNCPIAPAHEDGAIQVKAEEILTNETLSGGAINGETGEPSSLESFPAKQASGCISNPLKSSQLPLSITERDRILDSIPFESEEPFFKILIQRTYLGSRYLQLPIKFVNAYIKNQGGVFLSVPNGRSWDAKLRITPQESMNCVARLCKGWTEFVKDNNLGIGDVCVFKLLDRTAISFEVSIVRFAEYDCLPWS